MEREGRDELDFLINEHKKEMDEKEREFREKSQQDADRYDDLLKAEAEQDAEFKMRLAELVNHQQKQIKEMEQMHNLEKEAKEKEAIEL